ncbi:helix-turn-helix domain-containing protein [uncultured Ruegeria sp.]|uniref:helix-turn-helix transcriptional regulator n=1 Tax=uncultured Ruegeria sp. TaxID=259304 RepID=UPI00260A3CF3|nr:helix-turn-helix domain-containing protein [uncultured Ruegeria sp.]
MTQENTLLNVKDVAGMLNIGVSTVWRHAKSGNIPKPLRVGGSVRWRKSALEEWVKQQETA